MKLSLRCIHGNVRINEYVWRKKGGKYVCFTLPWLMWTPARSVHGVVAETRQIHTDYRDPVEEKG